MNGTDTQRDAYEGATEIESDPLHLLDRDNRNHRKKQRIIIDHVHADVGDPLLEVGCGHGIHADRYDDRYDYTGVDISHSLVAEAQAQVDHGHALQMDATNLAFPDDHFAAVVGTAILHHIRDQQDALQEWVRVTESGGSVALMEPNPIFPKDLIQTYTDEKERHKRGMFPWRLRKTLAGVESVVWTVQPRIYTPPWPAALHSAYDRLDDVLGQLPGVRWASQMQLIHLEVE